MSRAVFSGRLGLSAELPCYSNSLKCVPSYLQECSGVCGGGDCVRRGETEGDQGSLGTTSRPACPGDQGSPGDSPGTRRSPAHPGGGGCGGEPEIGSIDVYIA